MIECTLQKAIELCKENGGTCYMKGLLEPYVYHMSEKNYMVNEAGNPLKMNVFSFTTWIYEHPKQSAFQKWESTQNQEHLYGSGAAHQCRKEAWIGAIDAVLKLERNPARSLSNPNKVHPAFWEHEIEALKEP